MADEPIRSGRYAPDQTVTLTVWNEGENPPDGYDVIRQDDGSSLAVVKDRGDVKRDVNGSAYALVEGGALAEFPDGTVASLSGQDLDDFLRAYKPEGASSVTSTSSDSSAQAADVAAANPTTTTATGVTEPNNTGTTTDATNANDTNPANPNDTNPANVPTAPTGDGTTAGGDAGTGQGA